MKLENKLLVTLWRSLKINVPVFKRHHNICDVNGLRRESATVMAGVQPKQEKDGDDCSLLPLVHDIIKW